MGISMSEHESSELQLGVTLKNDSLRLGNAVELEWVVSNQAPSEDVTITTALVRRLEFPSVDR